MMAKRIQEGALHSTPKSVFRIEIKIHPIDEIAWIARQKSDVKIFGANQDNTACIAGIGQAAGVKGRRITSLKKVFSRLRHYLREEYPYLQWYGGLCFDPKRPSKIWQDFGAYRFVLPRFELASDASAMIFCCNMVGKISSKQTKEILKQLDALSLRISKVNDKMQKAGQRSDVPSKKQWDKNVATVLKTISQGGLEKIVLARQTKLKFANKLDAWNILRRLFEVTPNSYHFCFEFGQTVFLGASPERLYRKVGRSMISEAIAGTSSRGQGVSKDNELKEKLLVSVKNNREHSLVVKAIDEALQRLCGDHQHSERPQILTLGNGHHLITSFEGKLKGHIFDEDILKALHPTPAVAGVPQRQALNTLARLEGFERGWYTGLIGYVGLEWSEFVVGIRSALIKAKEMSVYAGAGIVQGSDADGEWQEIEHKISNFIKLIQ